MNWQEFLRSFWNDRLAVALLSYGMLAYVVIKGVGYGYWCRRGLMLASPAMPVPQRRRRACLFGVVRLLIGVALGIVLGPVFLALWRFGVLGYVMLYVPVRWLEWGAMELMLCPASRSVGGFCFGHHQDWKRWRLRGIALSCLLDLSIPIGVIFGLIATPGHGGRIFC